MQWRLNLDIISKCNAQGVYYDPQQFPIVEVFADGHIQDNETGQWVPQRFVQSQLYFDKSTRKSNGTLSNAKSKTGEGDTAVPRDTYTQTNFTPITVDDNTIESSSSEEIKIELKIEAK
jgi:hypothetical protein